jgi:hypothetical protein
MFQGMARKQTRRSVSLNKSAFDAGKIEANRRGMTFSGLVEYALAQMGVVFEAHPQQTPELVRESRARRAKSIASRPRPSRERCVLGDGIANACGFS